MLQEGNHLSAVQPRAPLPTGALLLLNKFPITLMSDLLTLQPSVHTHTISAGNLSPLTG